MLYTYGLGILGLLTSHLLTASCTHFPILQKSFVLKIIIQPVGKKLKSPNVSQKFHIFSLTAHALYPKKKNTACIRAFTSFYLLLSVTKLYNYSHTFYRYGQFWFLFYQFLLAVCNYIFFNLTQFKPLLIFLQCI